MRVVFVGLECESYAISLFSSLLKHHGHDVRLIFDPRLFNTDEISSSGLARWFDVRQHNIDVIRSFKPDLLCFSVYTQDYQYALTYARRIKQVMQVPIIFGGIHCILCPEQVAKESCIDWVCASEGEDVLVDLCQRGQPSEKFRLTDKVLTQPYLTDLDSLPLLDKEIYYKVRPVFKDGYTISTGRGCPYTCAYCASDALNRMYRERGFKNPVRQRSVDSVITELSIAKGLYQPSNVYFTDDVFTLNTQWLKKFSVLYPIYVNLPFYCTANPGTIKEEELHLLKKSGCQMVGFGMQSCNEAYRKNYLKRYGSNERIRETARICHQFKLPFSFDHIFDMPGEPLTNQAEAVEFYNDTRPLLVNTFTMTYLPKIGLNTYLSIERQQEVDNGEIRTSMFNRSSNYYVSLFALLPLLPRSWVTYLNQSGFSRFVKLPFPVRLLLKDIQRLRIGRYSDIFFPFRLLLQNIWEILRLKLP